MCVIKTLLAIVFVGNAFAARPPGTSSEFDNSNVQQRGSGKVVKSELLSDLITGPVYVREGDDMPFGFGNIGILESKLSPEQQERVLEGINERIPQIADNIFSRLENNEARSKLKHRRKVRTLKRRSRSQQEGAFEGYSQDEVLGTNQNNQNPQISAEDENPDVLPVSSTPSLPFGKLPGFLGLLAIVHNVLEMQ